MKRLLLLVSTALISAVASAAPRPNIILITIDTVRADHLGCYGYTRATSPNIDAFAKKNRLYKQCFSHASLTTPSVASIFSGHYPTETTVLTTQAIPEGVTTLAEIFKAHGYQTAAVVSNFVVRKKNHFNQGFDFFDDDMQDHEANRKLPERTADKTADAAIRWLSKRPSGPFFLWVHFQDAHGPYTPPPPFNSQFSNNLPEPNKHMMTIADPSGVGGIPAYQKLGKEDRYQYYVSQYDGEIAFLDHHLGRLLKKIDQDKLKDSSMTILTADHGEGMGERDFYFAHSRFLFPGLVHVPLILSWENKAEVNETQIQHVDLFATILARLGLRQPSRGQDLFSGAYQPRPIFMAIQNMRAVLQNNMQLLYDTHQQLYQLYDVDLDPSQRKNLVLLSKYSESFERLKKLLQQFSQSNQLNIAPENTAIDNETKENLKSLGYAQ